MQGDDTSALTTCPFFPFFQQMLFRPDCLDSETVFDQADLISLPVTLVESFDGRTGKGWTFEAKINATAGSTISYVAFPAMVRLALLLSSASLASLLFLQMHITYRAIHPARSQQVG